MPRLVLTSKTGTPQSYAVDNGRISIGRNPENTIVLDNGSVSSHHAEIIIEDGMALLRNLSSVNGTSVNGKEVTEITLFDGDEIQFGPVACRFEMSASEEPVKSPDIEPVIPSVTSEVPDVHEKSVETPIVVNEPSATEPGEPVPRQSENKRHIDFTALKKYSLWLLRLPATICFEVKRFLGIAILKARIQCVRHFSMNASFRALGRAAYSKQIAAETLTTQYAEVKEVEANLNAKRLPTATEESTSAGAKIARNLKRLLRWFQTIPLARKLNRLLLVLGKTVSSDEAVGAQLFNEWSNLTAVRAKMAALKDRKKAVAEYIPSQTDFSWWPRTIGGCLSLILLCGLVLWQPEHRLYGVTLAFFLISGSRYLWFSLTVPADQRPNLKWWRTPGAVAAFICLGLGIYGPHDLDKRQSKSNGHDSYSDRQQNESAAAQGDGKAAYMLAMKYKYGEGGLTDENKGLEWMKKGASLGNAEAQYELGSMYNRGDGVPKDHTKALEWYLKAANQGNVRAQFGLGFMYDRGQGVRQDKAKAIEWCQKAAAQGDIAAQTLLKTIMNESRNTPQSSSPPIESSRSSTAQRKLALMYANGEPDPTDLAKGIAWFEKAAAQGDAKAQLNLGSIYEYGKGVPMDEAKAAEWFRASAAQGNDIAQYKLGYLYFNGMGVPNDNAKAFEWFQKAADRKNLNAMNYLGLMYSEGNFVPQNKFKAIQLWHEAAMQGHSIAQGNLAFQYESGDGISKDYISAYTWYTVIAKNGTDALARSRLAFLEKHMTRSEIAKAVELSEDALSKIPRK